MNPVSPQQIMGHAPPGPPPADSVGVARSPANQRDLAIAVFFDRLSRMVDKFEPIFDAVIEENLRERGR